MRMIRRCLKGGVRCYQIFETRSHTKAKFPAPGPCAQSHKRPVTDGNTSIVLSQSTSWLLQRYPTYITGANCKNLKSAASSDDDLPSPTKGTPLLDVR